MEPTTFRNMDVSDLADDATLAELVLFRQACEKRQRLTGETDCEVTEWMWGEGDWWTRVHAALAD
jgi:hypothetical protein